jgi:1-acyl-sn-glycerol-3-phosphate acyltransferase
MSPCGSRRPELRRDPRAIETILRTALALLVIPAALIGASLICILFTFAGASTERTHSAYTAFSRVCFWVGGTRLLVRGIERIEPETRYVVVPNHDSGWDPMCLVLGLPGLVMRFVAKHEFMRVPIFGRALRLTGNVEVLRHETQGDVGRIKAAMSRRDPAVSILFFAEGTRSRDGALHPFKMGAFATAIGYGLPILPVGLAGTRWVWTPEIVRVRRGTVALEVGEPIPVVGLTHEDRGKLRDRTFEAVAALRADARQHLRDLGVDPGGVD